MANTQKKETQTTDNPDTESPGGMPAMTSQVKEQAQQAVQQGQEYAGKAMDVVRDRIKMRLAEQKDHLAHGITDFAQTLSESGDKLRQQGLGSLTGPYIDEASRTLTEIGTSIEGKDIDQVLRETEDFARVQPALFLGGAALAGFFAARFLKSTGAQAGAPA